jgi:hypothetical protein
MEDEEKKYLEIKLRRSMAYVWRFPTGTTDNYLVRDPDQPQESLCNLWHRVTIMNYSGKVPVEEKFWEK